MAVEQNERIFRSFCPTTLSNMMITLNLKLEPTADISANELDALNQYWQQMLLETGVDSIEPVKTAAPVGAKPIDLSMLNDFMVNFSAGLATTFVIALWSWLKDPANHMTKFESTRFKSVSQKCSSLIPSMDSIILPPKLAQIYVSNQFPQIRANYRLLQ